MSLPRSAHSGAGMQWLLHPAAATPVYRAVANGPVGPAMAGPIIEQVIFADFF